MIRSKSKDLGRAVALLGVLLVVSCSSETDATGNVTGTMVMVVPGPVGSRGAKLPGELPLKFVDKNMSTVGEVHPKEGKFEIHLPAGEYTVVDGSEIPCDLYVKPGTVVVQAGEDTSVEVICADGR